MSVGTADILKAINTVWDASGLDAKFTALWTNPLAPCPALNDQEGTPGQEWPYCVVGDVIPFTVVRMSSGAAEIHEIRDASLKFNVHAQLVSGDSRDAKEIAAYLVEEIMKIFGGHPTTSPTPMTLDNGNYLITLYENDFCLRTGDDEYQWTLNYTLRVDVPVAV